MRTVHCRFCNAEVIWAETASGKRVPLEPGAGFAGTYRVTQGQDGTVYAERIPVHSPASPDRYRLHFAVCKARVKS